MYLHSLCAEILNSDTWSISKKSSDKDKYSIKMTGIGNLEGILVDKVIETKNRRNLNDLK